jgi:RHS repeat-associated protein
VRRTTTFNSQPATLGFLHDGDGNRVRKTSAAGGSSVTTHYLVDELNPTGWPQVLEELTSLNGGAATVTRVNTWGYSLIGQDQFDGNAWQRRVTGMDAMDNVRFLTDLGGNVTDSFDYDGFGNVIARSGTTTATHLYRGEQFDADLGMYNLRARYYNPDSGRFWTRDSFSGLLDDPQSQHRYAYAQNNPVNRIDPSGHYSLTESLLVTGLLPDVRDAMDSLWSGINSFTHGLGGGEIMKAKNHASGLFVQGLVPETGVYLGRANFFNTIQGAPFLLSLNPYIYIPEYDCFSCQKVGFGTYGAYFGSVAQFPQFQFEESPLAREVASWLRGEPIRNGWNATKENVLQTGDNIGFLLASAGGYGEYYEGSSQLYRDIAAAPHNYDADKIEGELSWGALRNVASIGTLGGSDVAIAAYDAYQTGDVSGLENASGQVLLAALGGKAFGMPSYGLAGARAELQAGLATTQRTLEAARALPRSARGITQELDRLSRNRCLDGMTLGRVKDIYAQDAAQRMFVKTRANRALQLPAVDTSLVGTGTLGYTTPDGRVFLQPGLARSEQVLTLRHESVHAFFSPRGDSRVATFRQNLAQWGYDNSAFLNATEELMAQTHATGHLSGGIRHAFNGAYTVRRGTVVTLWNFLGEGAIGAGVVGGLSVGGYYFGNVLFGGQ